MRNLFRKRRDIENLLEQGYDPFQGTIEGKIKTASTPSLELLLRFKNELGNALTHWAGRTHDTLTEKRSYTSKHELRAMKLLPNLKKAFPRHAANVKVIAEQLGNTSDLGKGTTDEDIVRIYSIILAQMQQLLI